MKGNSGISDGAFESWLESVRLLYCESSSYNSSYSFTAKYELEMICCFYPSLLSIFVSSKKRVGDPELRLTWKFFISSEFSDCSEAMEELLDSETLVKFLLSKAEAWCYLIVKSLFYPNVISPLCSSLASARLDSYDLSSVYDSGLKECSLSSAF